MRRYVKWAASLGVARFLRIRGVCDERGQSLTKDDGL